MDKLPPAAGIDALATTVPATTDVHAALRRAADAERNRQRMQNCNFKANPAKQELAEAICARHGTTLSAFLRECLEGLVTDYVGPKAAERLDETAKGEG